MNTIPIRPFAAAKLLTFVVLVLALALTGCHITGIRGNGDITTESRTVPDFTSVDADGALVITWSNAPVALKITGDQNLLSHIETGVSDRKLRIHSRGRLVPTERIKVTLSSSALSGARLTGAVRLTASRLSGNGFYLEGTGATRVEADGTVNELMATMSGASRLDAGSLQAQIVELSISGAGKADVAASKILKVSISGAGKVTYSGSPQVEKEDQRRGKRQAAGLEEIIALRHASFRRKTGFQPVPSASRQMSALQHGRGAICCVASCEIFSACLLS